MDKITIIALLLIAATATLSSALPSVYDYGKNYAGAESGGYGFIDYQIPRYGSGYDTYVYGSYEGHAGDYDYNKILKSYQGSSKGYVQTPYKYGQTYDEY